MCWCEPSIRSGKFLADVGFRRAMMTAELKGKSEAAAHELFENVHKMLTGDGGGESGDEKIGKLKILSGVCKFPARVKCASLAWHTVNAALQGENRPATTE